MYRLSLSDFSLNWIGIDENVLRAGRKEEWYVSSNTSDEGERTEVIE